MTGEELANVLLVKSCEEEDPDGEFLPFRERERATRRPDVQSVAPAPQNVNSSEEAFVVKRAEYLAANVERQYAVLRAARQATQLSISAWPLLALAFVGGTLMDSLGPTGQINLLHFPLLSLVVWNAATYLWAAGQYVARHVGGGQSVPLELSWITSWRLRLAGLMSQWRGTGQEREKEQQWIAASVAAFVREWHAAVGPTITLSAQAVLHYAAAVLSVGVVLGMYVRGFAFEYTATWASTFLESGDVSALLNVLFYLAALVLNIDVPALETISALKSPGHGNAAVWIHLWAATCVIVIVIPRLALAWLVGQRAARLLREPRLSFEHAYFHRLFAPYRGEGARVNVLPYHCAFDADANAAARALCAGVFGHEASVNISTPIPYGETSAHLQPPAHGLWRVLIVYDLATTPEQEVHGTFLQDLLQQIKEVATDAALLVCVSRDHDRGADEDGRAADRWRLWEGFLQSYGVRPLRFSSMRSLDAMLDQAPQCLWSVASEEVV